MATQKQNAIISLKADTSSLKKDTQQAEKAIKGMADSFDSRKIRAFNQELSKTKSLLRDIKNEQQKQFDDFVGPRLPKGGVRPPPGMRGGGRGGGGATKGGGGEESNPLSDFGSSMLKGGLAMAGIATFMSGVSKRIEMARQRVDLASVVRDTGGTQGFELAGAEFGYSAAERRKRGKGIGAAFGTTNLADLSAATRQSEMASRAFGMGEDQTAGMMTTLRKGGSSPKAFGDLMEGAVQAGLDGSLVVEYLQEQASYLESIADQTINVTDFKSFTESLTSSNEFFRENAQRTMDVVKAFDESFSRGDRFQQARAARAIQGIAPGASMAAIDLRRQMGLFGGMKGGTIKELQKEFGLSQSGAKTLGAGGAQITEKMFGEFMKQSEGQPIEQRLQQATTQFGLKPEAAANLMLKFQKTGKITEKDTKEAFKTTEEKAADVMSSIDGNIVKMEAHVKNLGEKTVDLLGKILIQLGGVDSEKMVEEDKARKSFLTGGKGTSAITGAEITTPFGQESSGTLEEKRQKHTLGLAKSNKFVEDAMMPDITKQQNGGPMLGPLAPTPPTPEGPMNPQASVNDGGKKLTDAILNLTRVIQFNPSRSANQVMG